MMWARMDNHEKYREPLSDDTQSSTSTASRTGRFSAASSEDLPAVTKDQLEFYLKVCSVLQLFETGNAATDDGCVM